jgi:hypothetical protein
MAKRGLPGSVESSRLLQGWHGPHFFKCRVEINLPRGLRSPLYRLLEGPCSSTTNDEQRFILDDDSDISPS